MTKKPGRTDSNLDVYYEAVLGDISHLIDAARRSAARSVNSVMTAAYWLVGRRIVEYEQGGKVRAEYGEALLEKFSADLASRYGRGFGVDNLQRFRAFYLIYPSNGIYATLSRKSDPENQLEKYATLPRISQAQSTDKPDGSIPQTPPAELSLADIARCFPLPWSVYVRLLGAKNERSRRFYEILGERIERTVVLA